MTSMHLKILTLVLLTLPVGMLAQTQGCDVSALTNLLSALSVSPSGDNSQDDSSMDDNSMDDNSMDDDGSDDVNDDNDGQDDDGGPADVELVANLTGAPPSSGHARYRVIGARIRLDIEVEGATPGSVFSIMVNGVSAGDLTIDTSGEGEVEFDTQTEMEPDHTPWPAGVDPNLAVGSVIEVGSLSGSLAVGP
ncbi:MAG: hypothetical protein HZA51_12610 [Planctomycetes bacterium]|nr:hypothetical protein [Planctomycetota bacterium]